MRIRTARIAAAEKAYREKHKGRIREWMVVYREKNRGKINAQRREHYRLNRKEEIASAQRYQNSHQEQTRMANIDRKKSLRGRYVALLSKAKGRGLKVHFTEHDFAQFQNKPCFYCGDPFNPGTGSGLDRLDSRKEIGYRLDNVVPCCRPCNVIKMEVEMSEFYKRIEKILLVKRLRDLATVGGAQWTKDREARQVEGTHKT